MLTVNNLERVWKLLVEKKPFHVSGLHGKATFDYLEAKRAAEDAVIVRESGHLLTVSVRIESQGFRSVQSRG